MSDADTPETFGFDFAPDWARKSADEYVSRYQGKNYDERTGREERPRRDSQTRGDRRDDRRPRPPRRDNDGERRPRRDDGFKGRPRGPRSEQQGDAPRTQRPPRFERVQPLNADIRLLPNQKNLGVIIKTLQGTHTAFSMKKFVNLFLDNPQACLVRFEAKADTDTLFYSCKSCGFIALSEAEVAAHLAEHHLADYFDVTEEACEAPSGTYPCVAKCTLTGEWVGAPNHHSYRHRVAELAARTGRSEKDYLKTIEMCRDSESVEAWKQSVTTQTVYRKKVTLDEVPAPEAPAETPAEGDETPAEVAPTEDTRPTYNRDQAEAIFRRDILSTLITSGKHMVAPVPLAQNSPSVPLKLLVTKALRDEQRHPSSLLFALRGAFRHRKFELFRCNDAHGPEFVANVKPTPFTAENAVRELRAALDYVAAHPCCTRNELLTSLKAELADMDQSTLIRQVAFLFQRGHLLEFYNGIVALPETNPKFRKLPEESKKKPTEEKAEAPAPEVAPVAEAPASEAPVEVAEAPVEAPTPVAETPVEEAPAPETAE
ncbi:MAG: hypothetical protein Q4C03_03025 [bacterium]|nr:hypothetical protein [bacterium]